MLAKVTSTTASTAAPMLFHGKTNESPETDSPRALYSRNDTSTDTAGHVPGDVGGRFSVLSAVGLLPMAAAGIDVETVIDAAIDQAIAESKAQGIHGKETTPFLLARVVELTGGDSLESNIQLVLNNAIVASKTAAELCK